MVSTHLTLSSQWPPPALARARTLQVPRVPPADAKWPCRSPRHVGGRDGAGPSNSTMTRVAIAGRHLSGAGLVASCWPAGWLRPNQSTRHHHRRRNGKRDHGVNDRDSGTRWHPADLAYGGGRRRTRHCRGVLLPRLQRDSAPDPSGRTAVGRQRRRRRRSSGVPARRRPCGRRPGCRCDVPLPGGRRRGGAVPSASCCWSPPGPR